MKCILRYLKGTVNHGLLIQPTSLHSVMRIGHQTLMIEDQLLEIVFTLGQIQCIGSLRNIILLPGPVQKTLQVSHNLLLSFFGFNLFLLNWRSHINPLLYTVTLSSVALTHNPIFHTRTKHMELDLFFLRERVLDKSLATCWNNNEASYYCVFHWFMFQTQGSWQIFPTTWVWGGHIEVYG